VSKRLKPPAERSAYRECKAQGEFQAWKWVEKNQPGFEFNTVLPWFTVSVLTKVKVAMKTDSGGLIVGQGAPSKHWGLNNGICHWVASRQYAAIQVPPSS
jgi:hypothetical protein